MPAQYSVVGRLTSFGGLFCVFGCGLFTVPKVEPMVQKPVVTQSVPSSASSTVKRTVWPEVIYQSTSHEVDDSMLFSLDGGFGLGQFQLRQTEVPELDQVLSWPTKAECSTGCVSISVENGLPPELIFWIGLSTWFATLDEWSPEKIENMGFGVRSHVIQSLGKDFVENNQQIVQQIERDKMLFQPTLDIECVLTHEIFAEEAVGGTFAAQIADWLEEVSHNNAGRVNTSDLYFHADSELHFSQVQQDNAYKLALSMTDTFEDGPTSVFSDYQLDCHSDKPMWATEMSQRYKLVFLSSDKNGVKLKLGQR